MSSNISINLPKGWIKTRVEEVCKTKSGGTPSRKTQIILEEKYRG